MLKRAWILWHKFNIAWLSRAIALCDGHILIITDEGGGRQSDQEFQSCLIQRKKHAKKKDFHLGRIEELSSKSPV